ncbi:MAG: 50S ribosomal protein L5 [Planctomycetes bacterium]|nr:50S ribosomal protein L5 [Planctomycetota bacterium]
MARLLEKYKSDVIPSVKEEFEVKNVMQLPKVVKICVSMGMGQYCSDVKKIDRCAEELGVIVGQKAVQTKAKVSEAGFKVRKDMPVGCRVTLRGQRMWEFLDRFISVAAPRIADFHGFSRKGFDQKGNYSFGVNEQSIFPEVNLDKMEVTQGMNVNVVFENSTEQVSEAILEKLGFPFQRKDK